MEHFTTFIITTVTGLGTYLYGLRRGKADTDSVLLSNLEKSISIYQTIISDMKKELEALRREVDQLETKVSVLLEENAELKKLMLTHDANTKSKSKRTSA